MRQPVFSLIGRANTGKTTLLEKVIPLLKAKGIRVATIKHDVHDFEIDREGKDTYRHKKAGARLTMIASPKKVALVEDADQELTLNEILSRYIRDVDLVITEGYKRESMPKIEVYNYKDDVPPLSVNDPNLLAIISDKPIEADVPVFLRDEPEKIAAFIIEKFKLSKSDR